MTPPWHLPLSGTRLPRWRIAKSESVFECFQFECQCLAVIHVRGRARGSVWREALTSCQSTGSHDNGNWRNVIVQIIRCMFVSLLTNYWQCRINTHQGIYRTKTKLWRKQTKQMQNNRKKTQQIREHNKGNKYLFSLVQSTLFIAPTRKCGKINHKNTTELRRNHFFFNKKYKTTLEKHNKLVNTTKKKSLLIFTITVYIIHCYNARIRKK